MLKSIGSRKRKRLTSKPQKASYSHVQNIINGQDLPSVPLFVRTTRARSRPRRTYRTAPKRSLTAFAREKNVRTNLNGSFKYTRADSRHAFCRTKHKTFKSLVDSNFIKGGAGRGKKSKYKRRQSQQYRRHLC